MTPRPVKKSEKNHLPLLLAVLAVLGALVWFDHAARDDGSDLVAGRKASPARQVTAPPDGSGTASDGTGVATLTATGPSADLNPLAGLKREELRETVARPLFEPSRRPFMLPPAPPAPPPPKVVVNRPPPPDPKIFTLLGIVASGDTTTVLLLKKTGGRLLRKQQGDIVDGWKIDKVEPRRVTMVKDGIEATLLLFNDGAQPKR